MATDFMKYPKIKVLGNEENEGILTKGDEIIIEEKVDGGNFRFMLYNGNLIFGSRECQITSDLGEDTNIDKNFRRCVDYVRTNFKNLNATNYIFYGENCVKHSMGYDWEKMPPFLGFDIFDMTTKQFLDCDRKREMFELLGLIPIKLIKKGIYGVDVLDTDIEIPTSAYVAAPAEGIVIKNYTKQLFAKKVSDKFKEVNRDTFGASKKFAKTDDERIIAMYCTNPRIDKMIFKLVDEGEKLDMPMMKKLPTRVLEDIYEENWKEILNSNYSLDMRDIRSKASKRCLAVLRQVIENNAINKS